MPRDTQIVLSDAQRITLGNSNLLSDKIKTRNLLGNRMFNL